MKNGIKILIAVVAVVLVGAQPPDQPVAACPLGGRQALDLIQPFSPLSPLHS